VEHLHSALDALPEATNQEKEKLLYRRARQVDQLARFAISRILENDLREIYKTDVSIANFWSKPDDECTKLWIIIDLDAIT